MRMSRYDGHASARRHWFGGLALIVVGCALLMDRMNLMETQQLWHLWPALIALFGLGQVVAARHAGETIRGLLTVALAFWLYASIEHLWGWSFRTTWPFILIAFGLSRVLEGVFWMRGDLAAQPHDMRKELP